MADENTRGTAAGGPRQPAAQPARRPHVPQRAPRSAAAAAAAAPRSKKDMSPEERAAAIKAAQEKALRDEGRARGRESGCGGGTAVAHGCGGCAVAAAPAGPAWRIPAAGAQQVTIARPEARAVAEAERVASARSR